MNDLMLIGKIVYYLLFVLALFLYARYKYKYGKNKKGDKVKFGYVALAIFAVLFGVYGVICGPPDESIGDRHNYAMRFEIDRFEESVKESSLGLYVVESIIHLFSNESSVLFFVISVLYFCINIYCYKETKETTPFYLLLLFLSSFGLFGFYLLKQAMSLAFANLALTKYLQNKRLLAAIFIVVAILFHEAAWITIPCFILAKYMGKSNIKRVILYVGVLAVAFFFPQINRYFVGLFNYVPGMDVQIGSYLNESGSLTMDANYFTIFKSFSYYIITVVAIIARKNFKDKISNYDFFLVLSVLCSIFSFLSLYMYWMFRFATYCYVPCFILAAQLCINMQKNNRKVFKIAIISILLLLMIKLLSQYYFIYGGII